MTNPYKGYEYHMHAEDYLPAEEQITPTDPATLKGVMEVWRDTANQLDAEKLLTEKARSKESRALEEYQKELDAKLRLQSELQQEKKLKDLAIQELNGFREQNKGHLEKLRRHRDELAERVQGARKTLGNLDEWLESFDNGIVDSTSLNKLRDAIESLGQDLGTVEKDQETD